MVIITMLLIGIITSVVIVTAAGNLSNVMLFKRSSDNFYTAEHVLDELKNLLEDKADASVRVAYQNWLKEYSYNSSSEQHEKFMKLFIKDYKEVLYNTLFSSHISEIRDADGNIVTPFSGVPKEIDEILTAYAGKDVSWKEPPTFKPSSDTEIILNVKLSYIEDDGTESVIDTDLKFSINPEDFQINTASGINQELDKFAVVADGIVTNATGCAGDSVDIIGNLYGGAGLEFVNYNRAVQHVNLYSDKIITRNALTVGKEVNLKIKGSNGRNEVGTNYTYGDVWAKNVFMNDGTTTGPAITAQAHFFLSDDLTLNAKNSVFRLKGPESSFYGYGANELDVEQSSAIVINTRQAILDLEQVDPARGGYVSIAGKSFISVPSVFGTTVAQGTTLQGESISYKGEQAAYLLPSECIVGVGHNPMSVDDFDRITSDDGSKTIYIRKDGTPSGKGYVDIGKSALNGGVDLGAYVQVNNPVKSFHVRYDDSTTMVYLYLNFQNSDKATAYFEKFSELYPDTVKKRVVDALGGDILINPMSINMVGNAIISTSPAIIAANKRSSDSTMVEGQWDKGAKYNALINNLSEEFIGLGLQLNLTDNVVNMRSVMEDYPNDVHITSQYWVLNPGVDRIETPTQSGFSIDGGTPKSYFLYRGKDVYVNGIAAGIIVASGDVYFENGSQFTGLVVARGNVYSKYGANVFRADPRNIKEILQNCEEVNKLFKVTNVTAGTGNGGNIISSDIVKIEFENWKKK